MFAPPSLYHSYCGSISTSVEIIKKEETRFVLTGANIKFNNISNYILIFIINVQSIYFLFIFMRLIN